MEAFSYSVSHDLRAPLRAMDGFTQRLLQDCAGQLGGEPARYLQYIRDSSRKMGQLIDDLLAFSRISSTPVKLLEVDPNPLLREALAQLGPATAGRRIDLRLDQLPPCRGDPALLRQVWINLLSNAFKYTRPRDPAVVEVGSLRDEAGRTTYYVRDNGVGFDMRYVHKLFGVFERLHAQSEFEGTGVGLAWRSCSASSGAMAARSAPRASPAGVPASTFTWAADGGGAARDRAPAFHAGSDSLVPEPGPASRRGRRPRQVRTTTPGAAPPATSAAPPADLAPTRSAPARGRRPRSRSGPPPRGRSWPCPWGPGAGGAG
jgi:hypothetical protein